MPKCKLCGFVQAALHEIPRTTGDEATIKRYPTIKVCDTCFANKSPDAEPEVQNSNEYIKTRCSRCGFSFNLNRSQASLCDHCRSEDDPFSVPDLKITRKCVQCGKELDVIMNKNGLVMKSTFQICTVCGRNNDLFITIERVYKQPLRRIIRDE